MTDRESPHAVTTEGSLPVERRSGERSPIEASTTCYRRIIKVHDTTRLSKVLDQGHELGFVKQTDSPDFLGWILLRKRIPNQRLLSLVDPVEEPDVLAKEQMLVGRPYQVHVIELASDVFESGRYETEGDFRMNEVRYFSSLDEVEEFVGSFGYSLESIKWRPEINAP